MSLGIGVPSLDVLPRPSGGGGVVPPFSRLYFVDAGTLVPPGLQDGSVSKPYSTIAAAIAAGHLALPIGIGFCVWVTPGNYAEYIVLPDHDNMSIVGQDAASTILSEPPGPTPLLPFGHTITWIPAAPPVGSSVHRFLLAGITVKNSTAGRDAINIDGSAVTAPATFMDTNAELRDLTIKKTAAGNCFFARCAGRFYPRNCTMLATVAPSKVFDVSNVTTLVAQTCALNGPSTLEYTAAPLVPRPGTGRNIYSYTLGTTDFFDAPGIPLGYRTTLKGAPIFFVDDSSSIFGEVVAGVGAIDGTALLGFPVPLYQPVVILNGTFGRASNPGTGNITLFVPPDTGAVPFVLDLSRGIFNGTLLLSRPAAGLLPPVCFGRGASFTRAGPGFSVTVTAMLVGTVLNLDIRDCAIIQGALSTVGGLGTSSIDRSKHFISLAAPLGPGPIVVPIVPPFPAPVPGPVPGGYTVSVTPNAGIVIAATVPSAAKLPGAFTVLPAAIGAGYDFLLSRVE